MDWKRYYAEELASPRGRAAALGALARHGRGDTHVQAVLQAGGVVSFPHVSIHDAADALARVAQSILTMGAARVVALGVLHGGTLPVAWREAHLALQGTGAQAEQAFQQLGGAWIARGAVQTPFGSVDEGALPACAALLREDPALLCNEFSLDLFLALLAAAAQGRGVRPPPVTRLFVSATRRPDGSFQPAGALAQVVGSMVDADTVCVATGDLVHVGNAYTPAAEMAALPADADALQATLLAQIAAMHTAALLQRDQAAAWAIGTRLRSDQRHLLPVIAELLGPSAEAELLSFRLSDYAGINGVPPPSWVAAALVAFRPGGPAPPSSQPT